MPKLLLAVLVVLAVAACGIAGVSPAASAAVIGPAATPGPPDPTHVPGASSTAVEAGTLVTYETRGGLCANGPCGFTATIGRDGSVTRTDGVAQHLEDAQLARLVAVIEGADWTSITAIPFTGECPVNYDGQEQVYTFNVKGQAIVVASCTTQFDQAAEPFATVHETLFAIGG